MKVDLWSENHFVKRRLVTRGFTGMNMLNCRHLFLEEYLLYWSSVTADNTADDDDPSLKEAYENLAARFRDADTDKDGRLNKTEFTPFVHPFRHEHMIGHLVEDQLAQYDADKDGRLSVEEYMRES